MSNSSTQKDAIHKRSESFLTSKQKSIRERSLEVLSEARKTGKSLSKVSKQHGLSYKTVLHNTKAIKKVDSRWIAKKYDKIPRVMIINEKGEQISFEVNDSRNASKISKYKNAIKEFLKTGNTERLLKFRNKTVKDSQGNSHIFETDPQVIIAIEERKESPEFHQGVYKI